MCSKGFCGRYCFIYFQHDLAITGLQVFDTVLPLVFLDSTKEPFAVAGQRFAYVDVVTFRDRFAYFGLYIEGKCLIFFPTRCLRFLHTSSLLSLWRNSKIMRCFSLII